MLYVNCTSCVLGSECNIMITKSGFNERSISRIHNHSPAFCSKNFLAPNAWKCSLSSLFLTSVGALKEDAFWPLSRKKLIEEVNPDQNHREGVFPLDNINLAEAGELPSLVQHLQGSLLGSVGNRCYNRVRSFGCGFAQYPAEAS